MKKRLATWLANVIRAELERSETLTSAELKRLEDAAEVAAKELKNHVAALVSEVKTHATAEADAVKAHAERIYKDVKAHVSAEVVRPTEDIKNHIAAEISGQFDKILHATGVAAREALADARKTLRMVCDECKIMSWKFTVNAEGKVICGDCQAKGKA